MAILESFDLKNLFVSGTAATEEKFVDLIDTMFSLPGPTGAIGSTGSTGSGGPTGPTGPGSLRYVARLTQGGTAAPVASVKRNTLGLGTPTFGYVTDGIYQVSLAGLDADTHSAQVILNQDVPCTTTTLFNTPGSFFIHTWDSNGTGSDGLVNGALLVIEEL